MTNKEDNVQLEFDPFIAEKIMNIRTKKSEHVKMLINKKHNELVRKRKQERHNKRIARKHK